MGSDLPRDLLGRGITDLRISVTDRCNFRCDFCMPAHQQYHFLPKPEILSFEEIVRLARIFVSLGVHKIRLTGGEPLLRAEIEKLVAQLAAIPEIDDIALTTNAFLLPQKAAALAAAGLRRVTISLHSLDPVMFGKLNGLGLPLERVLAGIDAALAAGLAPVKLNAVIQAGVNDHELLDLARFGREKGCVFRFIEYMDVGTVNSWDAARVLTAREMVERIGAVYPLEPVGRVIPGEVAERWRYLDGGGEIGVISSVSQPFCGDCARARLSADGRLYTCLFSAVGHDLKGLLRGGASDSEVADHLAAIWSRRRDRYSEERKAALDAGVFVPSEKVEMFRIGG
jgi:GTP 3',8-cyclase